MRALAPILLLLLAGSALAGAEEWKGVSLVDTMCSAKVKDAPDTHTVSCALACEKGGFGIYTSDGTYLKFDDAGNKKALQALKATKKKDHIRANITGERDGDTIKVTSLVLE